MSAPDFHAVAMSEEHRAEIHERITDVYARSVAFVRVVHDEKKRWPASVPIPRPDVCRKWAEDLLRVAELAEQAKQITEAEADALNERAQRGGLQS